MWTEERLNKMLTTPSEALSGELGRLEGDILVLGAGGKMGPTLCVLAKNALRAAGVEKRVIAVSRFSDPLVVELLRENGVEMISADLLAPGALDSLPDAENVIYMAGKKFGTDGNEYATWAMNTWLPSRVAERYQSSRIVVFSSGNLYPKVGVHSGVPRRRRGRSRWASTACPARGASGCSSTRQRPTARGWRFTV